MSTHACLPEPALGEARGLSLTEAGLRYRLERAPRGGGGKVVAEVQAVQGQATPLRDRVDLYAHRDRVRFAGLVAAAFGRELHDVFGALTLLLDQVERTRAASAATPSPLAGLSEPRRAQAQALLARGDLLDRAARAMEGLGYVGEGRAVRLALRACNMASFSYLDRLARTSYPASPAILSPSPISRAPTPRPGPGYRDRRLGFLVSAAADVAPDPRTWP